MSARFGFSVIFYSRSAWFSAVLFIHARTLSPTIFIYKPFWFFPLIFSLAFGLVYRRFIYSCTDSSPTVFTYKPFWFFPLIFLLAFGLVYRCFIYSRTDSFPGSFYALSSLFRHVPALRLPFRIRLRLFFPMLLFCFSLTEAEAFRLREPYQRNSAFTSLPQSDSRRHVFYLFYVLSVTFAFPSLAVLCMHYNDPFA